MASDNAVCGHPLRVAEYRPETAGNLTAATRRRCAHSCVLHRDTYIPVALSAKWAVYFQMSNSAASLEFRR
jgi:isopentenyldiphosphate isomerase